MGLLLLALPVLARAQAPAPGAPQALPPPLVPGGNSPTLYLPLSAATQPGSLALPSLPLPVSLPLTAPGVFSPVKLDAQPLPTVVTLAYNPDFHGSKAVVAPLDGGTVSGAGGERFFTIGADGKLVFAFQPPARPGRYHVVVQLGGSEAAFPFDVADPAGSVPVAPAP